MQVYPRQSPRCNAWRQPMSFRCAPDPLTASAVPHDELESSYAWGRELRAFTDVCGDWAEVSVGVGAATGYGAASLIKRSIA